MKKPPRSYYRALTAKHNFIEFDELIKSTDFSTDSLQPLLNVIKRIFVLYWKFLRDLLKEKYGIVEYYPRKIITEAINRNLIDKSEAIWLEYIDMLNVIVYDNDSDKKKTIVHKIVDTYIDRIKIVYDFIYKKNHYEPLSNKNSNEISLKYDMPLYDPSEIGINENFYNLLLNVFKNNPEIRYVWVHGSRAEGNARKNSDIDLLIDAPLENFGKLKETLNRIRIPYRIDATSIYDRDNLDFIAVVSKQSKIIYRAEDYKNKP